MVLTRSHTLQPRPTTPSSMSGDRAAPPGEAPPPNGGAGRADPRAMGALPPETMAALQVGWEGSV